MDLIKSNTNNLTALWKIAGKWAGQIREESAYNLSIAESGEWPNKLWFTKTLDHKILADIKLHDHIQKLSIPIWGHDFRKQEILLKANGFEEKLTQVGMSMDLAEIPKNGDRITIHKVVNKAMAATWSRLFQDAFGYEISVDTVYKTMDSIDFFLGQHKGVSIGTAVLFVDQLRIAGIHSMGVIPAHRRKGYAGELLLHMLNIAQKKGATHATLQASDMGKGLYLKTGFQEDFIMKSFIKRKI